MTQRLPIQFLGTGTYVPRDVLTNQHFVDRLETTDDWIVTRTGIRERRRAASNECTSTMAGRAAEAALIDAGLKAKDLDAIICATATPDCPFPATAAFVQAQIGAPCIPAFDVSAACAGFLYATYVAGGLLAAGVHQRILVLGAETLTRYADPDDRRTAILFGDAAGAAILARSSDPERGILYCENGCDSSCAEYIWVPAGGARLFASSTTVAERLHYLRMRGREVYKFAVLKMQELIDRALRATGLSPNDLKLLIPHQSNLRIIESVRERMDLPKEKVAVNIDRYGNTSAASVILALDEARRCGKLTAGDLVMMLAVGAGLTWSIIVLRL